MEIMIERSILDRGNGAIGEFVNQYPNMKIALATICGSHSFGLAKADSDIDIIGVYIMPTLELIDSAEDEAAKVLRLKAEEYNTELTMYEMRHFLKLLIQPNMNMMDAVYPYDFSLILDKDDRYWEEIKYLAEISLSKAAFAHIQGMTVEHRKHVNKYNSHEPKRQLYIMREHLRGIILFEKKQLVNNIYDMLFWLPEYKPTVDFLLAKKKEGVNLNDEEYDMVFKKEIEMELRFITAKEFGPLRQTPQDNVRKLRKDLLKKVREDNVK